MSDDSYCPIQLIDVAGLPQLNRDSDFTTIQFSRFQLVFDISFEYTISE